MTKKNIFLVVVAVALAVVYVVCFTDWFRAGIIHIVHTSRIMPSRRHPGGENQNPTVPISFAFDRSYRLTDLKVVSLAAWETNHDVLPLWHLVSETRGAPIKLFHYGQNIRGMKSNIPGAHAEPLQANVTYRLFVAAGSAKGEHDFQVKAAD